MRVFGYIKPVSAELKVKEYELYRALYCGLCESLGRSVTCSSRLSLSYDFVFLALVRMALTGEVGKVERHRCLAHPTKKRAVIVGASQLDYTARLSAVLTYHKLRDDIADTRGFKRLTARLLMPFASRMRKQARFDKDAEAYIAERLEELSALEKNGCNSLDRAAEPFGELMAYAASHGFVKDSREERIAAEIGRHIGRFIYIVDAIDDFSDDMKSGAYNPLRESCGGDENKLSDEVDAIKCALTMELVGVEAAANLIDFTKTPEYGEIIKNIIYLGLPACTDKVLGKYRSADAVEERENGEQDI